MTGIVPVAIRRILQANKMKKMRDNLLKIEAEHKSFSFTNMTNPHVEQQPYDQRETTAFVNESEIIGRDAEKQELTAMLRANHDKTIIVPIYGLGGIGKTTLAQLVYNDIQFKKYDNRVWVYVSQVFDLKKIGRFIISQLQMGGGQRNTDNLHMINLCLDDLFRGKRILIVLDDIWEDKASELEKLKCMLRVHQKGSTMIDVIVTTRKEDIAKKICTNEPYILQPLNDVMCWDIIKRLSSFEHDVNKERLEHIGFNIATKCGGVALAAQALGYMLKFKDLRGWSEINNSDIWNQYSQDETVLPSLKLSYECMSPCLRMCFSYCAIFPKGHDIVEADLIHKWVAHDFINPSEGTEYVKQLLGMSFLRHSALPLSSRKHGAVRYTMHDLVHNLARSVIGDELIVFDAATKSSANQPIYCRYALLTNYDRSEKLSNILANKVRSLHFQHNSKLDLPCGTFSFAKCLRVLDFNECSSILLPASIGQLKQLKCLIATKVQNERLPECITELSKLQYLNLNGPSQISALPESIGKLGLLTHLSLSGCSGISKLPESFGDLKSLVDVNLSDCSGIVKLPESIGNLKELLHLDMSGTGITELPGSLGNLTNLNHLELSECFDLRALPESLCGITTLEYLNLSLCPHLGRLPEAIGSLVNLQYMNMSRCGRIKELPESFKKLKNLEHLDLLHCCCLKGLPRALSGLTALKHLVMSSVSNGFLNKNDFLSNGDISDALGSLTNLKYLALSRCMNECFGYVGEKSDRYIDFIGNLTNLEHLDLSYNRMLVYLPESIGNLKRLHTLDVSCCTELKSLPNSMQAINIKSLLVDGCSDELMDHVHSRFSNHSLTLPLFKVCADNVSGCCSNIHQLESVNAGELRIRCLENVRFLEEAQRVKLLDKQNLLNLTLAWTLDADRLLEDKDLMEQLMPPSCLQSLDLEGYRSISFPSWLMGISHHLPYISSICLSDLPTCNKLPPLGQLRNLENLFLEGLCCVRVIDRDFCGGKEAFCRLSVLSMERMEGLEEWNTTYCIEDGIEEYMFPVLDHLQVVDCPRLRLRPCAPTPRAWIIEKSDQVITSLEEIRNISHLSYTPSTRLIVRESSCQSLSLFHHFPTLENLEISKCPYLRSLPESMRHLVSLRSLELYDCERVSTLPDWLDDLSSLGSIIINGCKNIKFLPSCIQKLKRLQKLRVDWELKQWCESEVNKTWRTYIKDKEDCINLGLGSQRSYNCIGLDF
ncbi:hypothetical protein EJB05_48975, partial [Eragrostis curvula]